MFYKEIYEQTGPGSAFLEHLETHILEIYLLSTNHRDAFMGSMYVPICLKNFRYVPVRVPENTCSGNFKND